MELNITTRKKAAQGKRSQFKLVIDNRHGDDDANTKNIDAITSQLDLF
jgi:hypothetical protein